MSEQRVRIWFRKGDRVRYISHLDVLRYWERALRRAELPLSYSQGFTPHPKLAFAGPLPLGFTAENEIVDVSLDDRVDLDDFRQRLAPETTDDLRLVSAEEVPLGAPPPQAALLWADYTLDLPDVAPADAQAAVGAFLARPTLPWTEERREKVRTYDLRAATPLLSTAQVEGGVRLTMRLRADQELMARPEQVAAALFPGVAPGPICRIRLHMHESSPAREAWRRWGRFLE
jgi:radical SAM-linked protein